MINLKLVQNSEIAIEKNSKEEFRISVIEYKGHKLLNLRVWYRGEDGQMYPGKQGMSVRVEKARELWASMDMALKSVGG